jgi:RHS repeat-associated protein
VTDAAGEKVWEGEYTTNGELLTEKSFSADYEGEHWWGSKRQDEESGLYYFANRYYLAEIARFISVDPVLDGMNWYSYGNNNSLRFIDPSGLLSDPVTTTTTTAKVIDGFVKYGQYIENQFISAPPIVSPQKLAAADGPIPIGDVAALLVGSFMIIGYNVELIADFIWAKAGELKAKEQEKRTEQKLNESLPAGYTHEDGNYHNSKGEIVSQEEILAAKEKETQTELQRPLPPGYKRLDDGKIVNEEGKLVPNTCEAWNEFNIKESSTSNSDVGGSAKNLKYDPRVRARAVEDPVSHNFPYSFDEEILATKPIPQKNGYNIFQKAGTLNGKEGVFEIGVTKDGIIDHRFFRSN